MKQPFLYTILIYVALSACADRSASLSVANSSVSSGNADSSAAAESVTTQMPDDGQLAANANVSANAFAKSGGGGGGTTRQVIKQNISLSQTSASAIDTAASDRKIIRNAELNLEAENPEASQQEITSIAEMKGGFVVESQQSSSDVRATARDTVVMTVRVPSARFSETLEEIRGTGTRVIIETVKGLDVTEEFIDIEAQVKTKKALEQQFMEIMKRANTVGDALNVQSQLSEVRGEIERIEGRKRFLENQSSLSTIKIRLQTAKVIAATSAGLDTRLSEAFQTGFDVAVSFILGLVTFVVAVLPFAVLIGLPLFLIIRYVLRRQARPKSVTDIAEEEIQAT